VVRLVENREMDDITIAMTAALGCSGFVSYDFMLDEKTGRAALIEMNPRCVGSCHLGGLFGHDICGALVSELSGLPAPQPLRSLEKKFVALFPKELERDPGSPYLHSSKVLHDVPGEESALIDAYLKHLTKLHPSQAAKIFEVVQRDVRARRLTALNARCHGEVKQISS
jgi:biotin carboxylase